MTTLLNILLHALSYPHAASFDDSNIATVQQLIVWLENTKIRHYPIDQRVNLQNKNASKFISAFQEYMSDVSCPIPWTDGSNLRPNIEWFLNHAIGLEYSDKSPTYNDTIVSSVRNSVEAEDWIPPALPPFPDLTSQETQEKLTTLLLLLHIDIENNTEISYEALQKAKAVLASQILPTITESHHTPKEAMDIDSGDHDNNRAILEVLSRFPLGFTTGDPVVDAAATVLRMLYIKDLRELQTQIDAAIVAQQELTANPRSTLNR